MFARQMIIITGGSSGIGAALAELLSRRGARLALIARGEEKLAHIQERIKRAAPAAVVEIFAGDVSSWEQAQASVARAVQALGPPHVLINSAGILAADYFERLPLERFRAEMDTNFFGALHMIRAVLPFFRYQRAGRIINVSSLAGVLPIFGYSSYCASKFAMVGLSETLRAELKLHGITLHLVLPPEVKTPMLENVEKHRPQETAPLTALIPALPVDTAAAAILAGIEAGKFIIIPGARARLIFHLSRLFPSLSRAITDRQIQKSSSAKRMEEDR